jgi:7,8-dihydropterin-6-yl-methyl-4-(beta-D-ribofuranosyl)aminobenzene 5'-phosphate synthase
MTKLLIVSGLIFSIAGLVTWQQKKLQRGIAKAEEDFKKYIPSKLYNIGCVENLSITPLVDWHADATGYKTEMGVSYLIETDEHTILFDLGYNKNEENPSPLTHNMRKLGVEMSDIDMIFISHNHFDHVGGKKWSAGNTFSPENEQIDLGEKEIYTPIKMTYPGQNPVTTREPQKLATGIATIGTIPRELITGKIEEQSLAINIKDKGILLVVGCSHQTLPKIIKRSQDIFDEPIYGIIGGLHFPVPEGRLKMLGGLIDGQRWASGNGPLDPISQEDVERNIQLMKKIGLKIVGVGGHDSSDDMIELLRNEFGEKYRDVKVGKKIDL